MVLLLSATWFFFWFLLPATLFTSVIFRFNGLSAFYCLYLITLPYSPRLRGLYMRSWRRYCFVTLVFSGMFVLAHAAFQVALAVKKPYGSLLGPPCSFAERTARYVGFQRLDSTSVANICRLIVPDVTTFIVSVITMILINKSEAYLHEHEDQQTNAQTTQQLKSEVSREKAMNGFVLFLTVILLAVAGIAYPSVVSSIYLLSFITLSMMWAFHKPLLTPAVALMRAFLCAIASFQLLMLYLYQIQHIQDLIPKESIYTRLFGLTPIIYTNCTTPNTLLLYPGLKWTVYVGPASIFLLLWSMAVGVRMFFRDYWALAKQLNEDLPVLPSGSKRTPNSERRPLVQGEELPQNYDSMAPSSNPAVVNGEENGETAEGQEIMEQPNNSGLLHTIEGQISKLKHFSFYVVALIIMMVWSVTYHSWLTFVLLIWSCGLWMTKERSWYTLCCSPVFTIYGIAILLIQFIYSLDLNESELPTTINQTDGNILYLSAFGMRRYAYPCLPLGAQVFYLCGFWLVLHQFNYIRRHRSSPDNESTTSTWAHKFADFCKEMLSRYWIFLVIGFHIAIATEGYPTGIKFIYFFLFVLNITAFIVSWPLYRKTLTFYWFVLLSYTMVVLVVIYTYQFQSFPNYWKQLTNFDDKQLADLGLIQYTNEGQLLLSVMLPALFLLVVILQLHYFNERFLEVTGPSNQITSIGSGGDDHSVELENEEYEMNELRRGLCEQEEKENWFQRKCRKMCPVIVSAAKTVASLFIRGLEFHVWRLVFITVFCAAAYKVSAIYGVYVIFWICLLPARITHRALYVVTIISVSIIILGNMFFQLQFISPELKYNCTFNSYGNMKVIEYEMLNWIGIFKMNQNGAYFNHVNGFMAIILMILFERVIMLRQQWHLKWRNIVQPTMTAFYPTVTWQELDLGIVEFLKYFVNFAFYKFGVEACFVMSVVTVWVRADMYAVVYALLLIIALSLKTRLSLHRYWKFYSIILLFLLILQYLICIGMPPVWCVSHNYPWLVFGSNETERDRLVRWMFLPDYLVLKNSTILIADFFQFLFIVSQLYVFEWEKSGWERYGGDNSYLTGAELDHVTIGTNPRKNFMLKKARSLLDQLKSFVFKYMIWVSMAMVFIAGTTRISLFCLGYIVAFFYLLSKQQELLLGKPSRLLKVWNVVLGYNVAVITLKISLQIASCVYIETLQENACAVVQLFSLVCSKSGAYGLQVAATSTCELSYTNSGLTWDFICFLFLLIQRRIFSSYYFLHVTEDLKISLKLAARGAELFNDKLIEDVKERESVVQESLSALKSSMKSIKNRYRLLRKGLPPPTTHTEATRSGDYYMFDEEEHERKEIKETKDEIMDPIKMLHKLGTVGIDETLVERKEDKKKLTEDSEVTHHAHEDDTHNEATHDETTHEDDHDSDDHESDHDACEDEVDGKKQKTFFESLKQCWKLVCEFVLSGVDYLTLKLNKGNLDYRNVTLRLESEKDEISRKKFKEERSPRGSTEVAVDVNNDHNDAIDVDGITIESNACTEETEWKDLAAIEFDKDQHWILRFFYSFWFVIISRTDVVCYFLFILNLMLDSSILSLVLPLAVFFWASFCIPRPTTKFWNFSIVYLQLVIVVRFIFQFEFFPWNSQEEMNLHQNEPFWWPRFIGIEQSSSWMVMDLLQLLAVVFHVSVLKVHGLWDSKEESGDYDVINETEVAPTTSHEAEGGVIEETNQEQGGEKVGAKKKPKKDKSGMDKFLHYCQQPYFLYTSVLNQQFLSITDVYVWIFLCDVINFIIIVFGYWAFGAYSSQQTNVVSDLQSNQVPTGFLVMLLIQFSMMIIDRVIYLRKSLRGKLIFQIFLVAGVHIWLFFILPAINNRPFYQNGVAQTWYFFKALYFLLSSYQIRCGYPNRVTTNFLTNSHGTVNLFLFKGYRLIPFLAEATTVMNWTFTKTSMSISEWLKLWSIHAEVFELKCWRSFEEEYPSQRGSAKAKWVQYLIGGSLVFLIFFIIWFPLLLMNIALTIGGVTNNPTQVDVKITLGSFEPLFQVIADSDDIKIWTESQFDNFQQDFSVSQAAAAFLSGFQFDQVVTVTVDGESKTIWTISPPQYELLVDRLSPNNTKPVRLLFEWTLTKTSSTMMKQCSKPSKHDPSVTNVVSSYGSNSVMLNRSSEARQHLYQLLKQRNETNTTDSAFIMNLFPQYIHSQGTSSTARPAYNLYQGTHQSYTDVRLTLRRNASSTWWRVFDDSTSLEKPMFEINIFSDKVSPASLQFIVSYGLIGLYVSVVLVVGRLVRAGLVGATSTIMFLELPYVDRILQLCNDIYLVQEEKEFELEEDLYAKLIFLYRSPTTLIKWSRPKVD
uniref:piezo-type mechanosensitive ion channel component 1-like isoform X4 n=1 Tax=Ciona intestinalis TaxID=7719 RepID=UPI000EF4F4F5|nr:piezo-type mechanosensitive ion channel component 1-like isoform X4 [Ciona intestinalis]|eukprot:XP_026690889.1 piezo-type mechanosensitive ion channel component 1-like isoform X4 [Ciona intestinalis]